MPYASNNDLPKHIKKYSKNLKDQWRSVFNSIIAKGGDEAKAFRVANGLLKRRLESHSADSGLSDSDYFNLQVDKFLGNI